MTDSELLQVFVRTQNVRPLADVVRRHMDLVYGTAHRFAQGEASAAQDITEQVFLDLRAKAPRIARHPCLAAWLYANVRFVATHTFRVGDRRSREAEPVRNVGGDEGPPGERLRMIIDDALEQLDERDRQLIVLRYLAQRPPAEVAARLALNESAAQKATHRALELLAGALARRGIEANGLQLPSALDKLARNTPVAVSDAVVAVVTAPGGGSVAGGGPAGRTFALAMGAAVLVALSVVAGYWMGLRAEARRAPSVVNHDREYKRRIETLEQQLEAANRRANTAEADTNTMLAALERMKTKATAASAVAATEVAPSPAESTMPTITVVGQVNTPARIHFVAGLTLQALIDRAGGFRELARRNAIRVERPNGDGTANVYTIDMTAPEAVTFVLQANDVVYVPERVI